MLRTVLVFGAALGLAATVRADGELNVGDKAPKLAVAEFVKGDPVKELAKGKVHVVEFWATWCGPCIATIPHLTKLQKEHQDAIFIGVSVMEKDSAKVKPFVEKMGEKMEYRVATDSIPEGKKGDDGVMAKTWLTAAGQDGIPTAFIVNADGVIAWIGHPAKMDQPLADIVAGKWDLAAAAKKFKEEMAAERKLNALGAVIQKAMASGDVKGAVEAIDEVIKDSPKMESQLAGAKFRLLVKAGNGDAVDAYGRKLLTETYKTNANELNNIAWLIVDPDQPAKKTADGKLGKLAVAVAERSNELTKMKNAAYVDTLACAHHYVGNAEKAVEFAEKAVELAKDDDELVNRLKTFKKALEEKKEKKGDK